MLFNRCRENCVYRENFDDSVQCVVCSVQCAVCSVQVVARPDSVKCLEESVSYFDQEINGVQWPAFLQRTTFGNLFNQGSRGAGRPSALHFNNNVVCDDFEHLADRVTSATGARVKGWSALYCVWQ